LRDYGQQHFGFGRVYRERRIEKPLREERKARVDRASHERALLRLRRCR
jgi:hypothetical protein